MLAVVETRPEPGVGPSLHRHDFEETFYVLDGELTFKLGDDVLRAGSGDRVFAPRGAPHTFANFGDSPAHQLILCTPAGFERYFARTAAERQGVDPPEWALEPIPEVETLGPPLDASELA